MYSGIKIRNLRFVPYNEKGFLTYVEQQILRSMHVPRLVKSISKADQLSQILEHVVRSWVKPVGGSDHRVISFESFHHQSNSYRQHYRELDLVINRDDHIVIGELKVSYSAKSRMKAHRQLKQVYQLASRMDKPIHLLLIHINLLPKQDQPPLVEFDSDFRKCKLQKRSLYGDFIYGFLHLKADDIFNWGLQSGIIADRDKRLLLEAKEEAGKKEWIRRMRKRFIDDGVPPEKWPSVLKNAYAAPDDTPDTPYAAKSVGNPIASKLKQALKQK